MYPSGQRSTQEDRSERPVKQVLKECMYTCTHTHVHKHKQLPLTLNDAFPGTCVITHLYYKGINANTMTRHFISLIQIKMTCMQNSYLSGHSHLHAMREVHELHREAWEGLSVRAGVTRLTLHTCPNPHLVNVPIAIPHTVYQDTTLGLTDASFFFSSINIPVLISHTITPTIMTTHCKGNVTDTQR